jgi:hypothetical protein
MKPIFGPHPRLLRAIRIEAGLTQEGAARVAGVNGPRMSRAERPRGGRDWAHAEPPAALTPEQWLRLGPSYAFGDELAEIEVQGRVPWVLACAHPEDPKCHVCLLDEKGNVGVYTDLDTVLCAWLALAAFAVLPWPFPLPAWPNYIESIAGPKRWYYVDAAAELPPGEEALSRRARAAAHVAGIHQALVKARHVLAAGVAA